VALVALTACGSGASSSSDTIAAADTRALFQTWGTLSTTSRAMTCGADDRRTVMITWWLKPDTEFDAKTNRWVGQPSDAALDDFLDAVCPTVQTTS
jgi:hypothetical protein